MLRNSLIGFGMLPVSFAFARSILDEKLDYQTLSEPERYGWKHGNLKDRAFYSIMILSFGSLITLATGSLVWMAPGAILTTIAVPMLIYAEKKD